MNKVAQKNRTSVSAKKQLSAVLYARVSSKEQEEEGYSVPSQLRLLREYADRKGVAVAEEFVEVETARKAGRKAFEQMLKFVREGEIQAIIVEKTDRLYRNFSGFVKVDDLGTDLHFVKEGQIITSDSHSSEKLMHSIKVCLAKNYVDNLSEEIRKGMAEKALQGIYPTHAPLGYLNVADGARKMIAPDPVRAPLIGRLFETFALGQISIQGATKLAWDIGLRTKKGNRVHKSSVAIILINDVYMGRVNWRGEAYEGRHEHLVDEATFYRVQEILAGRNSRKGYGSVTISYRGLIKCAKCGGTLSGEIKKGKYVYYHCSGRQTGCDSPYVKEELLTAQFAASLEDMSIPPNILEDLEREMAKTSETEERFARDQRRRLEAETGKQRTRLARLYEDKVSGEVSPETYRMLRDRYESELARAEEQLRQAETSSGAWTNDSRRFLELAATASDRFKQNGPDARRELLGMMNSNFEFDGKNLAIEFRYPFNEMLKVGILAKAESLKTGQPVDWWR